MGLQVATHQTQLALLVALETIMGGMGATVVVQVVYGTMARKSLLQVAVVVAVVAAATTGFTRTLGSHLSLVAVAVAVVVEPVELGEPTVRQPPELCMKLAGSGTWMESTVQAREETDLVVTAATVATTEGKAGTAHRAAPRLQTQQLQLQNQHQERELLSSSNQFTIHVGSHKHSIHQEQPRTRHPRIRSHLTLRLLEDKAVTGVMMERMGSIWIISSFREELVAKEAEQLAASRLRIQ
jgi:hypothetical protein